MTRPTTGRSAPCPRRLEVDTTLLAAVAEGFAALVLAALLVRAYLKVARLSRRLKPVLDAEQEALRIREAAAQAEHESTKAIRARESSLAELSSKYTLGVKRLEEVASEVAKFEENLENIEVGLYQPHFTYEDSESYKAAIERIRATQKQLIRSGEATQCNTTWTVSGSAREGERMVRQTEKLILRAFNAESEAAVANVTWNNYEKMRARIEKAFDVLNKHGTVLQVSLTHAYQRARLKELQLVYEAAERKRIEREEQRQQRIAQREEEKVQKELQRAQEEAAREEVKFEKALVKAREELSDAQDAERDAMQSRIAVLEADLAAAHDKKERALAQAQLTKVGHIYIISNIGAFGDGVVKIGMTRRLEPEERVRELGDASVPFPFDLHALIYSDNAPELEARFHEHFRGRRVNWSNNRKEFFQIQLSEIQTAIRDLGLKTELKLLAEAREYRETMTARGAASQEAVASQQARLRARFPEDPFDQSHARGVTVASSA